MIINVTEEQKKLIESQGCMVVEFKAWYKKMDELLAEYAKRMLDTWSAIITFLQGQVFKLFDSLKDLAERLALEFKPCIGRIEDIDFIEKPKYPFIRSIGIEYQPYFRNKVIYHRCRDRC